MAEERRETIERAWVAAWDRGEVDALRSGLRCSQIRKQIEDTKSD